MQFECVSRTDVGLKRQINEDSLLVRTERGLWAVADGMGGHDAGEVASAKVVDALAALPAADGLDTLVQSAVEALLQANRELITLASSNGPQRTIGSTAVGLAIAGERYCCFWAGDSRAYRLRGGTIERLSKDHSLVQGLIDAGMLKPEEAEDHENANVITRAVGVMPELVIDTVGGDVRSGDLFLLASDGLTRLVGDEEIAAELESRPLDEAADRLIEMVLARGAPDNVSLVITRVS
jgi:serine/threonine protein phosphatase PrpC